MSLSCRQVFIQHPFAIFWPSLAMALCSLLPLLYLFLFYQLGPDCKPAILADDLRFKHASNDISDGEIRPQSPSGSSEIKSLIDGRRDEKGILVSKRPMAF